MIVKPEGTGGKFPVSERKIKSEDPIVGFAVGSFPQTIRELGAVAG
jgi:hypothetical protein